jgi:uncharacterized protein (TIGR00369 family)
MHRKTLPLTDNGCAMEIPLDPDDLPGSLDALLARIGAPWVRALGLRVTASDGERTTLHLPVSPDLVHGGGVMCGQATLAAADTAMVLGLSASLGRFQPMTTVQLQTSFLRPVPADTGHLRVVCTVLRRGRSIAFGEVSFFTADDRLVAQATTSYALL